MGFFSYNLMNAVTTNKNALKHRGRLCIMMAWVPAHTFAPAHDSTKNRVIPDQRFVVNLRFVVDLCLHRRRPNRFSTGCCADLRAALFELSFGQHPQR